MMPNVDGFALVEQIRGAPALAEIPVVLLTAHAGSASELRGLNLGADGYLVKPFAAQELRGHVAARLAAGAERRQRHAVGELSRELADGRGPEDLVAIAQDFFDQWLGAANTTLALLDDDRRLVRLHHSPGL